MVEILAFHLPLAGTTVLTLIVTPSALMVFTREKRPARGEHRGGFLSRLLRRRHAEESVAETGPEAEEDTFTSFPKAAE